MNQNCDHKHDVDSAYALFDAYTKRKTRAIAISRDKQ